MNTSCLELGLLKLPGGRKLLRFCKSYLAQRRFRQRYPGLGDGHAVFQHHYESNWWGNAESVSGAGSTLLYSANIRNELPRLVQELGIRVILDAPCGDFNWFKAIESKSPILYLGGDIVGPLVERNRALHKTGGRSFMRLDIVNDELPEADLWLSRDCLFHLSERDIFLALDNFLRSKIEYLLTSIHGQCKLNTDIPSGWFRLLDLQLPPFNLGQPIRLIDD